MVDINLDVRTEQVAVDISIKLDDVALDGGVYMFLLDGIPLYIGEANIFLSRLTYHLYELKKDRSYFGLEDLEGSHKITYIILTAKLPYDKIKNENSKRATDKNRNERVEKQNIFIKDYKPMTQEPIFFDDDKILAKLRAHRKDAMIKDGKTKNKIIKCILNNKKDYSKIIKMIENKEYQEK